MLYFLYFYLLCQYNQYFISGVFSEAISEVLVADDGAFQLIELMSSVCVWERESVYIWRHIHAGSEFIN